MDLGPVSGGGRTALVPVQPAQAEPPQPWTGPEAALKQLTTWGVEKGPEKGPKRLIGSRPRVSTWFKDCG